MQLRRRGIGREKQCQNSKGYAHRTRYFINYFLNLFHWILLHTELFILIYLWKCTSVLTWKCNNLLYVQQCTFIKIKCRLRLKLTKFVLSYWNHFYETEQCWNCILTKYFVKKNGDELYIILKNSFETLKTSGNVWINAFVQDISWM